MSNASHEFDGIELADAVQAVRDGLTAAAARGAGEEVAFDIGPIAMEFEVEIRRDVKGSGGVKAWIFSAGAEAARGSARTHRVSFTLTPKDARTGGTLRVGNQRQGGTSRLGGPSDQ